MKRIVSCLACCVACSVALGQPSITWKSHADLSAEANAAITTQSKTLDLDGNYLLTKRTEFTSTHNGLKIAGDADDRLIPGIAITSWQTASGWHQIPGVGFTTFEARIPSSVRSSVWYVNIDLDDKINDRADFETALPYEGTWERLLHTEGNDPNKTYAQNLALTYWMDAHNNGGSSFTISQPLAAAIGKKQLTFACADIVPSGTTAPPKYAVAASGSSGDTILWNSVPSGVPTLAGSDITYSRESTPCLVAERPSWISASDWEAKATIAESSGRCTVFAKSDYDSLDVGIKQITTTSSGLQIKLSTDPWNVQNGGLSSNFNKAQRFRLYNLPELLDAPGEMVLDTEHKRIYFIPWTQPIGIPGPGGGGVTYDSTQVMDGTDQPYQILYVGLCQTSGVEISNPPLSFSGCSNITLDHLDFRTATSEAIRAANCSNFVLKDSVFNATGQLAVQTIDCADSRISRCTFDTASRGFVKLTASEVAITGLPNSEKLSGPVDKFLTLTSMGLIVEGCTFKNAGRQFPSAPALEIGPKLTGVTIGQGATYTDNGTQYSQGNTFEDLPGIAIGLNGAKNLIKGNTFTGCVKELSDFGVIYLGRSIINIGNKIENNTFTNCTRYDAVPGNPTSGLMDDVACIMLDDFQCGTSITGNTFKNYHIAVTSNGGRYNFMSGNTYKNADDSRRDTNLLRMAIGRCADTSGDLDEMAGSLWIDARKFFLRVHAYINEGANGWESRRDAVLNAWDGVATGGAYAAEVVDSFPPAATYKEISTLYNTISKAEWTNLPAVTSTYSSTSAKQRLIDGDILKMGYVDGSYLTNTEANSFGILGSGTGARVFLNNRANYIQHVFQATPAFDRTTNPFKGNVRVVTSSGVTTSYPRALCFGYWAPSQVMEEEGP